LADNKFATLCLTLLFSESSCRDS